MYISVRFHVSCVKCCVSHVTCHQRQQPQALPLLNLPLCTIHYFKNPSNILLNNKKSYTLKKYLKN